MMYFQIFIIFTFFSLNCFAEGENKNPQSSKELSAIEQLEEEIQREKILSLDKEIHKYMEEVRKNVAVDGKWVSGNPGLFALGNPHLETTIEADYEWLTKLPESVLQGTEKFEAVRYSAFGAPISRYNINVSKRSYNAQTAACNRTDFPNTHFHTFGALHTDVHYGLGWPSPQATLGVGLALPPGVGEDIAERGPKIALTLGKLKKEIYVACRNPITKKYYECVHSAEYLPFVKTPIIKDTSYKKLPVDPSEKEHPPYLCNGKYCCPPDNPGCETDPNHQWNRANRNMRLSTSRGNDEKTINSTRSSLDQLNPTETTMPGGDDGVELGFPSGYCIDVKPVPYQPLGDCCNAKVKITHSIDYLFPTSKLSLSKQQQLSKYIPAEDIDGKDLGIAGTIHSVTKWMEVTEDFLRENGIIKGRNDQQEILGESLITDATAQEIEGFDQYTFSEDKGWIYPWGNWNAPWSKSISSGFLRILLNYGVIRDYKVSPGNRNSYHYPHIWPGMNMNSTTRNFELSQAQHFTDALNGPADAHIRGLELSYWLTESNFNTLKYKKKMASPEQCLRHNADLNTAYEELALSICPEANGACDEAWTSVREHSREPRVDFNDACLDDSGDIFPLTAISSPNNSDYILQTIAKGINQYMQLYREGISRFSFDRRLDRFHFFPSGDLTAEEGFPRDQYAAFRSRRLHEQIKTTYDMAEEEITIEIAALRSKTAEDDEEGIEKIKELEKRLKALAEDFPYQGLPKELNDSLNMDVATENQCMLFDEINSKPSYKFKHVNKTTPELLASGGEVSGQIFTNFSGCWGFPDKQDWNLANGSSGILRFLPSYWDKRREDMRVR